jgi:hypothetical protein
MFHLSLLCLVYFLPTLIAAHRGHHITGILLLNLFFGWTGIGWFVLLLWALLSAPRYVLVAPCPNTQQYYWRRY